MQFNEIALRAAIAGALIGFFLVAWLAVWVDHSQAKARAEIDEEIRQKLRSDLQGMSGTYQGTAFSIQRLALEVADLNEINDTLLDACEEALHYSQNGNCEKAAYCLGEAIEKARADL
jgi:hypothetical protein